MASSKNIFDSSVRLARVDPKHSGQYECQPSPLQSAIINLHVVKGKHKIGPVPKYLQILKMQLLFIFVIIAKKKRILKNEKCKIHDDDAIFKIQA